MHPFISFSSPGFGVSLLQYSIRLKQKHLKLSHTLLIIPSPFTSISKEKELLLFQNNLQWKYLIILLLFFQNLWIFIISVFAHFTSETEITRDYKYSNNSWNNMPWLELPALIFHAFAQTCMLWKPWKFPSWLAVANWNMKILLNIFHCFLSWTRCISRM